MAVVDTLGDLVLFPAHRTVLIIAVAGSGRSQTILSLQERDRKRFFQVTHLFRIYWLLQVGDVLALAPTLTMSNKLQLFCVEWSLVGVLVWVVRVNLGGGHD